MNALFNQPATLRAPTARPAKAELWSRAVLFPPLLILVALSGATAWLAVGYRGLPHARSVWVSGLTVSVLAAGLVFQSLRWRVLRTEQARKHLWALERLTEISTAINARIDAPKDALNQLATAACDLLEMDRAGIALLDPEGKTLNIVEFVGDFEIDSHKQYSLDELPMCKSVVERREPIFIEDFARFSMPMNAEVARRFRVGGMVTLPLYVAGRMLGILFASTTEPRVLSDDRRRLARLLGNQAAAILSNGELYKRMGDSMRNQQRLYEHREAIFAVNAAVYQASSFHESLQIIAELAPGVLDVDICMVNLHNEDDDRATIAGLTRPYGDGLIGKSFARKGTNSEIVGATRRMLVIDDARNHPGTHPAFRERLNAGSVIYLPLLRTGGQMMGCLVLIRHAAGGFTTEQLTLAEMFTSRAAAAVENAHLLDQTRHDADTKAMLLRELNHRVKNNLTSIITLLSLDEPEMSATARQWLRRAIDRIRTMARTHDLFAGGIDRVPFVELVGQVIPSLSVVKPPGVDIRMELAEPDVLLRTDRAVGLAMVLHELCSNAIIHGTGPRGLITIRASLRRDVDGAAKGLGSVFLEVIDQGRRINGLASNRNDARERVLSGASLIDEPAASPKAATASPHVERIGGGGLGLLLVRGLVTNELRGTFELIPNANGGSAATVIFPIGGNESDRAVRQPTKSRPPAVHTKRQ